MISFSKISVESPFKFNKKLFKNIVEYLEQINNEIQQGVSSSEHIILRALAKNLLNYTSLSVAEISNQLKFETPNYFVRLFRKYVGMTPKQYRDK